VGHGALDRCAQARDVRVLFLIIDTEFTTPGLLARGHVPTTLIALIGDHPTGVGQDLGDRGERDSDRIMDRTRNRIRNVEDVSLEVGDDLEVVSRRPVLAGPQLPVPRPGPARTEAAVEQARPAGDRLNSLLGGRDELAGRLFDQRRHGGDDLRDDSLRDVPYLRQDMLDDVLPLIGRSDRYRIAER